MSFNFKADERGKQLCIDVETLGLSPGKGKRKNEGCRQIRY